MNPIVYLIGAGPGDPDLLTLRGAKCLRRSDVVLYDGLSNAEILRLAPAAEHICVGKHGQSRIWKQREIIDEMLRHARAGRTVARLKGGDPAVFARTAEEVDALREAKIAFEIVPGITAALAAGSYAGIPITDRKLASAVALVTGHEEPEKTESSLDWNALAIFPGTLVIYMGVTTAGVWTDALITAGKDPATPTALVRRCSHPDQGDHPLPTRSGRRSADTGQQIPAARDCDHRSGHDPRQIDDLDPKQTATRPNRCRHSAGRASRCDGGRDPGSRWALDHFSGDRDSTAGRLFESR